MKLGLALALALAASSFGVVASPTALACVPYSSGDGTGANAAGHGIYTFPYVNSGFYSIEIWLETNDIPGLQKTTVASCGAVTDYFVGYACASKFIGGLCPTVQPPAGQLDPCRASGAPEACAIPTGGCDAVLPGCSPCSASPDFCSATGAQWCGDVYGAPVPDASVMGVGTPTARSAACGAVVAALFTACGRPALSPCGVHLGV